MQSAQCDSKEPVNDGAYAKIDGGESIIFQESFG